MWDEIYQKLLVQGPKCFKAIYKCKYECVHEFNHMVVCHLRFGGEDGVRGAGVWKTLGCNACMLFSLFSLFSHPLFSDLITRCFR